MRTINLGSQQNNIKNKPTVVYELNICSTVDVFVNVTGGYSLKGYYYTRKEKKFGKIK